MKFLKKFVPELVDDARDAWKWLSVWMFALIGVMPDAYEAANALGLFDTTALPEQYKWLMRIMALAGIYFRLVRQKAKAELAEAQPADPV